MHRMEVCAFNEFTCADRASEWACYKHCCRLQRVSLVTGNHLIDASDGFELGEDSWIGGRSSQVWTHAGDDDPENDDLAVTIGDHCCGARVLIAPGSSPPSRTAVSMGSTVIRKLEEPRCLIGGVPASVLQTDYDRPIRRGSPSGSPGPISLSRRA